MLEHRRLFLVEQSVNKKSINKSSFKIYNKNKNKNILIVTYGDGLVDCLMAKDFLSATNIEVTVMSIIKFLSTNKNNLRMLKKISNYKKIIFFDTRPFNFGPLNSILGLLTKNLKRNQLEIHTVSPQDTPAPSSQLLIKKYYPTKKDIIRLVLNISGNKQKIKINLEKDYMYGFPKLDLDKF